MLTKLHAKLGDFWWYSLMLFCACRAADILNVFVGLWLVPKYVGPSELGAVMPLTQFANFLAIPIAAFASTFRNEISRLSIEKEFGKLKTLMQGVFIATAIFLFFAIIVARFTLPGFLERIRIIEGSLGMIIIATSFISALSPIYSNTLQALKKFKEQSLLSIAGAPVRLLTMLATMPFRALSGYFIGQAAVPIFTIVSSIISLRKELAVKAEKYWTDKTLKKFATLFVVFLIWTGVGGLYNLVESTVIRQRLPDLDSAGFYMATRFSEIANYLLCAINFAIFPFAAELAAKKKDTRPLILKSAAATFAFSAVVALPFFVIGQDALSILPHGEQYAAYWWTIPWLIGIGTLTAFTALYVTGETSANRFGFLKWYIPCDLAYVVSLLLVTEHTRLIGYIPSYWSEFLESHNISSLESIFAWMTIINVVKAICCLSGMVLYKPKVPDSQHQTCNSRSNHSQQQIHVALSSDDNYFEGLLVTAWTITANCSSGNLIIHILDGGISNKNWNFLQSVIPMQKCTLNRIKIDQETVLKNFPDYHGASKMTFARLLLPALLPSVSHIIYSDVDIVWLADISKLWALKDDTDMMTVVSERAFFDNKNPAELEWFNRHGFKYDPERYFCAGMVVFNLGKMRSEKTSELITTILKSNNWRVPNNDQTILNALMFERKDVSIIDQKWQTGTGELPNRITSDMVIHYAADTPWKSIHTNHHMLTNAILFWHKIHAHIRGISTWQSLRTCNSAFDIIVGRILHILAINLFIVRTLLRIIMFAKGNKKGIPCLNAFMRKTNFPSV